MFSVINRLKTDRFEAHSEDERYFLEERNMINHPSSLRRYDHIAHSTCSHLLLQFFPWGQRILWMEFPSLQSCRSHSWIEVSLRSIRGIITVREVSKNESRLKQHVERVTCQHSRHVTLVFKISKSAASRTNMCLIKTKIYGNETIQL